MIDLEPEYEVNSLSLPELLHLQTFIFENDFSDKHQKFIDELDRAFNSSFFSEKDSGTRSYIDKSNFLEAISEAIINGNKISIIKFPARHVDHTLATKEAINFVKNKKFKHSYQILGLTKSYPNDILWFARLLIIEE